MEINWVDLLELISQVLLIVLFVLMIISKGYITKLGEKLAEVSTTKIKTEIDETVKQSFRVELATMKANLDLDNKKHEIDYSNFQQKRFDVVVELYVKLAIMLGAAFDLTNPFIKGSNDIEEMGQRGERFKEAKLEFHNYLVINKLFIEEKLFNELLAQERSIYMLCKQYEDCFFKIRMPGFTTQERSDLQEQLTKISIAMPTELSAIENDLRKLIYPTN